VATGVQFSRDKLDHLLSEHRRLIHLINDLEYRLYQIGEPAEPAVRECQQAASALIGCLRDLLFRHDQEVFPALESLLSAAALPGTSAVPASSCSATS
jgi:hemerythrin-like domain-containing protein